MLLQDKKGLSIMIGYVLLVAIAIIMSLIVYQFIKTYIPREAMECPDGASIFVKEITYNCSADTLEVIVKNNGLFSIAGYFIRATTTAEEELATKDLSDLVEEDYERHFDSVVFAFPTDLVTNSLAPSSEKVATFDVFGLESDLVDKKIEIIPVRFQIEEGKTKFASCSDARVEEVLSCA